MPCARSGSFIEIVTARSDPPSITLTSLEKLFAMLIRGWSSLTKSSSAIVNGIA